jgi:hypothetical protein
MREQRTGNRKEKQEGGTAEGKPITNYQLPITNYQLPITNYQLPITNYSDKRNFNWYSLLHH